MNIRSDGPGTCSPVIEKEVFDIGKDLMSTLDNAVLGRPPRIHNREVPIAKVATDRLTVFCVLFRRHWERWVVERDVAFLVIEFYISVLASPYSF